MGKFTEDNLKKGEKEPRDELGGVKVLNTFYDLDLGTILCLVDAPDRYAVERHHSKFGIKCDWITPVRMTAGYDMIVQNWRMNSYTASNNYHS
jgi:hypothetical protein